MSTYVFSVYNAEARDALDNNREHPHISMRWATPCRFSVEAESPQAAESCIKEKYPREKGFVTKRIH
ncbi:hypothetical protein GQF03_01810 [Sneathiella chungangensis]|uniref:Uncharacterized protein n=1 Tax=Sneathiella chungangensis TaxID=1418234 RepID=A0A845MCI6_9PROT|nr:hypothetical protein [Sneathiella chungangensis]MZR21060.1 hypothetical protein [Sneathiella chungangensis]